MILDDRVTDEIREKNGDTYVHEALLGMAATYPGFAYVICNVKVSAKKAAKYAKVVRDLGATLAQRGVTPDELDRARAQAIAGAQQDLTSNEEWLAVLAGAQEKPNQLAEARSGFTDFARTTVADLNALAARYLTAQDLCQFTIVPVPPAPPGKKPAPAPQKHP